MGQKKKGALFTIIGVVLCVIFIPIIVVNFLLVVDSYRKPDALPGVFGISPAIVLSGSMEPAIHTGDFILIHRIDPLELQEGDVVCYLSSGKAVTHRIVSVSTGEAGAPQFITRGDANNAEDRLAVTADQVQGIWRGGRVGGLGSFILFMQSTTGMILFILCPLVLFILWDIWHRRRLDRAEAARTAQLETELAALRREKESVEAEKP